MTVSVWNSKNTHFTRLKIWPVKLHQNLNTCVDINPSIAQLLMRLTCKGRGRGFETLLGQIFLKIEYKSKSKIGSELYTTPSMSFIKNYWRRQEKCKLVKEKCKIVTEKWKSVNLDCPRCFKKPQNRTKKEARI